MAHVDLFVSGFPCQSFASAGHTRGTDDPRGLLAHYSLEYIRTHRPKVLIFENVAGLLHRKHKDFLDHIKRRVVEEGYELHLELVNTLYNGLPQNRPRV